MKIAVMSDTHDNIWSLREALVHLASADVIIHCGDLCSPFVIKQLGEAVGEKPVHVVWGNNDGDQYMLSKVGAAFTNIQFHGQLAELEVDALRIAINHYPEIARGLAESGKYGLVFYGHNHKKHEEWVDDCLLINPGEVMGLHGHRSLALVDTHDRAVTSIEIEMA
jgi:putative phosphoesterase